MRIDTRAGSQDYIAPLRRAGVQIEEATLAAGDVEILGNGPDGRTILVGVEIKSVEDAVACMRSGRFAEQLRGMRNYFEVSWLLIEGRIRSQPYLAVQRGTHWFEIPGKITYQEFSAWIQTMSQKGGALLWRTEDEDESISWLKTLNNWWTTKEYEDHVSHLALYVPEPPPSPNPFDTTDDIFNPKKPLYWAHRFAYILPHLGNKLAETVARHFRSSRKIANASIEEWQSLDGVGPKVAGDLVRALEEEK